jgi:hypothetical protein
MKQNEEHPRAEVDVEKMFAQADKLLMRLRIHNLEIEKPLYDIQALLFQIQDKLQQRAEVKEESWDEILNKADVGSYENATQYAAGLRKWIKENYHSPKAK